MKKVGKFLDTNDSGWLACIINSYGKGDHPYASKENVHEFSMEYAISMVEKAMEVKNPDRLVIALNLIELLKSKRIDNESLEVIDVWKNLCQEIYYGFNFRMTMMENPELISNLKKLVEKAHNAR